MSILREFESLPFRHFFYLTTRKIYGIIEAWKRFSAKAVIA